MTKSAGWVPSISCSLRICTSLCFCLYIDSYVSTCQALYFKLYTAIYLCYLVIGIQRFRQVLLCIFMYRFTVYIIIFTQMLIYLYTIHCYDYICTEFYVKLCRVIQFSYCSVDIQIVQLMFVSLYTYIYRHYFVTCNTFDCVN